MSNREWAPQAVAICRAVANVTGVNELNIRATSGVVSVREARAVVFAALRMLGFSFARVGKMCGGYTHTTIMSSLSRMTAAQTELARSVASTFGIKGDDESMAREKLFRRNVEKWRDLCNGKYAKNKELARGYFSGKSYAMQALEGGIQ